MENRVQQRVYLALVAVASMVLSGSTAIAQNDPLIGTWKLNVAKSKFTGQPPMSRTNVIEAWETDGIKQTDNMVQADGIRVTAAFFAHYDGKDYKVTGSATVDTIAFKRLSAYTVVATTKNGGKVVATGKSVVSKNGKTRTVTTTVTNGKGQKVRGVTVYDRQ